MKEKDVREMRQFVIECPMGAKHWRIRCRNNNEIICHSEEYYSTWNRNRAAKRLEKLTGWPHVIV